MPNILCSIYDAKAEYWSPPRVFRTKMDALRSFESAINSGEGYGMHPEDFSLFEVGEFYEDTGLVVSDGQIVIENGINLLKPKESV